jgi:hypothetical protein
LDFWFGFGEHVAEIMCERDFVDVRDWLVSTLKSFFELGSWTHKISKHCFTIDSEESMLFTRHALVYPGHAGCFGRVDSYSLSSSTYVPEYLRHDAETFQENVAFLKKRIF